MAKKLKAGLCYIAGIFVPCVAIGGCYPMVPAYMATMWMLELDRRLTTVALAVGIVIFVPLVEGVKYELVLGVGIFILLLFEKVLKKKTPTVCAMVCGLTVAAIGVSGELLTGENSVRILRVILESIFTMTITLPWTVLMNRFLQMQKKQEEQSYKLPGPEQLSGYAKTFQQLSKVMGDKLERRPYPYMWKKDEIRHEIEKNVCNRCQLCAQCGLMQNDVMDSFLIPLILPGKEMDVEEEEKRIYFKENCIRSNRMEEEVCHIFERAKLNLSWYNRLLENREMVAEQLNVMAELMDGYSKDYRDISVREKGLLADLTLSLKTLGLRTVECTLCQRKNHHWELVLVVQSISNHSVRVKDVSTNISKTFGRSMQLAVETKVFITEEPLKLIYEDVPKYYLMQGIARLTKEGEPISGDNFSVMTLNGGKAAICLSDGMGSGEAAFSESTTTIEMMEAFLQAGLEPEMAIHMMNSAMVLYSKDDMFSTLDLCVGDLHSGNFRFYKVGAAPSFLKHGQYVESLSAVGLPAGTFYRIEVAEKRKKLSDGEYIIMMTDGLLDFLPVEDNLLWMQECISKVDATQPARMAEEILEEALQLMGNHAKDDMTVCVCGLWENE